MDFRENLRIMKVSLRVLAAISNKAQPDAADVDTLRYYLGSGRPPANLDELACEVIKKAIERRARMREALKAVERVSHLESNLVYSPHAPDSSSSLLGRDPAAGGGVARLHAESKPTTQKQAE